MSSPPRSRRGTLVRTSSHATTTQATATTASVVPLAMRVAVISDIHGNAHALDAVLEAIAADDVEAVWSLGDVVGYGPRPNRCCRIVREATDVGLRGNHDLACVGLLDVRDFSPDAAESAQWTSEVLDAE